MAKSNYCLVLGLFGFIVKAPQNGWVNKNLRPILFKAIGCIAGILFPEVGFK